MRHSRFGRCAEDWSERQRRRGLPLKTYHWYKLHGICVRCNKQPTEGDAVMCTACAEKWREYYRTYMRKRVENNREQYNAYMREYMRKYRAEEREWVQ